jgi:Tfp pilus assembly protein PilX
MLNRLQSAPRRRQRGSSLVVGLIILILVAILGVTGMMVATTQAKQAGNIQFQNAAFNNAEGEVSTAASWLYTGNNFRKAGFTAYSGATPYLYPIDYMATNGINPLTMTWSGSNSQAVGAGGTQRSIVEKVAAGKVLAGSSLNTGGLASSGCKQVDVFRVTARGTNARGTVKLIQTYNSVLSC